MLEAFLAEYSLVPSQRLAWIVDSPVARANDNRFAFDVLVRDAPFDISSAHGKPEYTGKACDRMSPFALIPR